MKKVLAITSGLMAVNMLAAEGGFKLPEFNIDSKIEYNTKWVSDGAVVANHHFKPSVEIGLPVFDKANVYVGMDAYLKTKAEGNNNRIDPYIGAKYDITDIFSIDLGYRAKINATKAKSKRVVGIGLNQNKDEVDDTNLYHAKRFYNEIYVGLMADVLLNPSIYATYDFNQKKINLEGSVRYNLDLSDFVVNGLAVDLSAKLGYCNVKKPLGIKRSAEGLWSQYRHAEDQKYSDATWKDVSTELGRDGMDVENEHTTWGDFYGKKGFMYGQINADLVYSLNENAKVRAGVGFAFNTAKNSKYEVDERVINNGRHYINKENGKKRAVWFSTAAEFSF